MLLSFWPFLCIIGDFFFLHLNIILGLRRRQKISSVCFPVCYSDVFRDLFATSHDTADILCCNLPGETSQPRHHQTPAVSLITQFQGVTIFTILCLLLFGKPSILRHLLFSIFGVRNWSLPIYIYILYYYSSVLK